MIEQHVEIIVDSQGHVALMKKANAKIAEWNAIGYIVIGIAESTGTSLTLLFQKGEPSYTLKHEMPFIVPGLDEVK